MNDSIDARTYEDISEVVEWVSNNIKRVRWEDPEKLENDIATRNVEKIIKSGETHYMGPCHDFTSVAARKFDEYGYKTSVLVQFKESGRDLPFDTLHYVLVLETEDRKYSIDFAKQEQVRVKKIDDKYINDATAEIQYDPSAGSLYEATVALENEKLQTIDRDAIINRMIDTNTKDNFEEDPKNYGVLSLELVNLVLDHEHSVQESTGQMYTSLSTIQTRM